MACMEGIVIPSPPILAGRANRAHSKSLGGGLLVSVGMSSGSQKSSSGFKSYGLECPAQCFCPGIHHVFFYVTLFTRNKLCVHMADTAVVFSLYRRPCEREAKNGRQRKLGTPRARAAKRQW